MSETSIVSEVTDEIKPKKVQSESLKSAKAKYYSKKKLDPEFMEQNRSKAKKHYIQNAEHHKQKCREYFALALFSDSDCTFFGLISSVTSETVSDMLIYMLYITILYIFLIF